MNVLEETKVRLKAEIRKAVEEAGLAEPAEIPEIILEKPKEKAHGDFAANIAMQLAGIAKKAPRSIAQEIVDHMDQSGASIEKVEIAGPGFINFFMKSDFLGDIISTILEANETYGRTNTGEGKKVQVEFVSVNPTGDLHLGHARGAAFGDVLCNVLAAAGYDVDREYYINDGGNQIHNLGMSVEARYLQQIGEQAEVPEDGYHGQAVITMAEELVNSYGDALEVKDKDERLEFMQEFGLKSSLKQIAQDLSDFRVEFDYWFSERSLYEDDQISKALEELEKGNYIYEEDGATWFRTTEFGDDKDRVLIKQDKTYTYFTPDIAYHKNKLDRGYDKIINVWGADHHGYIPRMRAAIQALGYPEDKMSVKIMQMVNLLKSGEKVRMSKRTGKAVSLRELMNDVGVDAARYYFVTRSNDSQLDFDIDIAKAESNDNPIYYVQYAHARICTMLEQAENKGLRTDAPFDAHLLTSEKETDLLKKLGEFPQVIADAAEKETPHKITNYVFDLASALHSFYNAEKVLDLDNEARTNARIALMKAVRITIFNALRVIGVSAPEKM